jgi:transcriptional regulator with XRE-family HTH domain
VAGPFPNMNRIAIQRQLGRKIRKVRQSKGLTREALATMCRIKPGKIWNIENGRVNPTLATLARISKRLGTKLGELLKGIQ